MFKKKVAGGSNAAASTTSKWHLDTMHDSLIKTARAKGEAASSFSNFFKGPFVPLSREHLGSEG